jgi:hypothetical protein
MQIPTRQEIELKLVTLIEGNSSREEVSDWASPWVFNDDDRDEIVDYAGWRTLNLLSGADTKTIDRPYLFGKEDFIDWLSELRNSS